MHRLTVTDPTGITTVVMADKFKAKGKTLWIYDVVGGVSEDIVQLEKEVLTQIRHFITLIIEEEE